MTSTAVDPFDRYKLKFNVQLIKVKWENSICKNPQIPAKNTGAWSLTTLFLRDFQQFVHDKRDLHSIRCLRLGHELN